MFTHTHKTKTIQDVYFSYQKMQVIRKLKYIIQIVIHTHYFHVIV